MSATIFYDSQNEIAFASNSFLNSSGALADPTTVSCVITDPANTSVTHTYNGIFPNDIVKVSTGKYTLSVPCSPAVAGTEGLWGGEWAGTGLVSDVQPFTWRVFPAGISQVWYIGLEELKSRLGITDSTDDYELQIAIQAASQAINTHCVVPSTMILTADLRWVPAGDLIVGQEIVGVDEEPAANSHFLRGTNHNRAYRRATVLATPRRMTECVRLIMSDGREVTCATDHRWLARWNNFTRKRSHKPPTGFQGHGYQWAHAQNIVPGVEIASPLRVWPEETGFEAGWVSGLYDGEGWLTHPGTPGNTQIGFGQTHGAVLDGVMKWLDNTGIPYYARVNEAGGTLGTKPITRVEVGTRWACMELMGRLRPRRLIQHSDQIWEDRRMIRNGPDNSAWVIAVEPAGVREVVSLGTSTGTYLANGLVSHNCGRHFNRITETRTFQPHSIWALDIDDAVPGSTCQVNLDMQGLGNYSLALTQNVDYVLKYGDSQFNQNVFGEARPYRKLQIIQTGNWLPFTWPFARLDRVQIITTWGWPAIPSPVTQGAFILAPMLFKAKDAPFGTSGNAEWGVQMIRSNPLLKEMLSHYVSGRAKVGV